MFTRYAKETSNTVSKYPLLGDYYDAYSGLIVIPLSVVNGSSEVKNSVMSLLKESHITNGELVDTNWCLEICAWVNEDGEVTDEDAICLRQVMSW